MPENKDCETLIAELSKDRLILETLLGDNLRAWRPDAGERHSGSCSDLPLPPMRPRAVDHSSDTARRASSRTRSQTTAAPSACLRVYTS